VKRLEAFNAAKEIAEMEKAEQVEECAEKKKFRQFSLQCPIRQRNRPTSTR
jgi:hypothetical protein